MIKPNDKALAAANVAERAGICQQNQWDLADLDERLCHLYEDVLAEPIPPRLLALLGKASSATLH